MIFKKLPIFSRVIFILCTVLFAGGVVSLFYIDDDAAYSRIAFSTFEVALMMIVICLPSFIKRLSHRQLTPLMETLFVSFAFSALILGDVVNFYGRFPWWDDLLHGISGVMLGIVGYGLINVFNRIQGNAVKYSPLFVSVWVVCFALALGALWEIMEFITDGLFGLNSQQFLVGTGTFDTTVPLEGHEALRDTMQDLMLDLFGSLVIAVVGYFDMKKLHRNLRVELLQAAEDKTAEEKAPASAGQATSV